MLYHLHKLGLQHVFLLFFSVHCLEDLEMKNVCQSVFKPKLTCLNLLIIQFTVLEIFTFETLEHVMLCVRVEHSFQHFKAPEKAQKWT